MKKENKTKYLIAYSVKEGDRRKYTRKRVLTTSELQAKKELSKFIKEQNSKNKQKMQDLKLRSIKRLEN